MGRRSTSSSTKHFPLFVATSRSTIAEEMGRGQNFVICNRSAHRQEQVLNVPDIRNEAPGKQRCFLFHPLHTGVRLEKAPLWSPQRRNHACQDLSKEGHTRGVGTSPRDLTWRQGFSHHSPRLSRLRSCYEGTRQWKGFRKAISAPRACEHKSSIYSHVGSTTPFFQRGVSGLQDATPVDRFILTAHTLTDRL